MSIIGHVFNAILIYFLVRKLFASNRIAIVVSILFAVHPIAVGTVAWLSGQSTVYSTFFLLLTCTAYLKFKNNGSNIARWIAVLSAAFFYSIGTPGLILILILIGIDLLLDSNVTMRHIAEKGPMLFLWMISLLLRLSHPGGWLYLQQLYYDSTAMLRLGITEIIVRFFVPWHDTLVPSADEIAAQSSFYGESIFPLVILLLAAVVIWNRKKEPVIFCGFLFLVGASLPLFTGRVSGNMVLADRSFYLSVAGIYLAMGGAAGKTVHRIGTP